MIQSCYHCGIPLQRASQYIGVIDVILGLLNSIILAVHLQDVNTYGVYVHSDSESDHLSSHNSGDTHQTRIRQWTFPGLHRVPTELLIVIGVCHVVQFIMGIVLYISASNKSRAICLIWLGITAVTALFTGLLFRLYEMLIVNEFTHELKEEQEVTYFPGQHPQQIQHSQQHQQQQQPYHQHPNNMMQPMSDSFLPVDSHVSVITIPTVGPAPTTFNNPLHPSQCSEYNPPPTSPYYPPITPMNHQYVPAALQPPPQYDVAVGGAGMYYGGSNGASNGSTGHTVESVIFPNGNNDYGKSFSKI